jgi:hypothetical protein
MEKSIAALLERLVGKFFKRILSNIDLPLVGMETVNFS